MARSTQSLKIHQEPKPSRMTKRWFTWTFSGFCFFFSFCLTRDIFSSQGDWYSDRTVRISMALTNAIQLFSFGMLSCLAEQKLCFCPQQIAIVSLSSQNTKQLVLLFLVYKPSSIFDKFWNLGSMGTLQRSYKEATIISPVSLHYFIHKLIIASTDVC